MPKAQAYRYSAGGIGNAVSCALLSECFLVNKALAYATGVRLDQNIYIGNA